MKQTIRLRESELRHMISECVRRVLKETRGYVSNDGNGMVGGYYGSNIVNGSTNILGDFLDTLYNRIGNEFSSELEDFENYCTDNEDVFTINGVINLNYDESTGYGTQEIPNGELEDVDTKECERYIMNYPTQNKSFKQNVLNVFDEVVDSLNIGNFDIK